MHLHNRSVKTRDISRKEIKKIKRTNLAKVSITAEQGWYHYSH